MNRPQDSQVTPKKAEKDGSSSSKQAGGKPSSSTSSSTTSYLVLYNSVSAALWSVVLGGTIYLSATHGYSSVFETLAEYVKWVQTLAVMEVEHAVVGIVRAPILTTAMQVASRLLLVWGIAHSFPGSTAAAAPAYASMLLAWSLTEVIRYGYFVVNLTRAAGVPRWLILLRYNTFLVLYPLGISSECWLVYSAIGPARGLGLGLEWVLGAILLIYVPGSYVLFTHMLAQRRKVMKSLK